MTAALKATRLGLQPHYKVRVVLSGAIVHLATATEPDPVLDADGSLLTVRLDEIDDPAYGDTLGYIDWRAVSAVSWRWSE